jgi:hypothetical protein
MIQEIIDSIKALAHKSSMPREMTLPTGAKAVLTLDASGNEVLHYERKDEFHPSYLFTSIKDQLEFIRSIPERYGVERAAKFRELYVYTENDIPVMFSIADNMTGQIMLEQLFTLRDHPDFMRWFSGTNMTQTEFKNLLLELPEQHDQPDLIGALGVLNYRVEVNYEASVETERNVQLAYSEKELKGSVVIPKTMTVVCPVIAGADFQVKAEFIIMIIKPKNQTDSIKFKLVPHGKTVEKIKQEACNVIAETEFVKPAQEIIAGFATTVPALYLRANIKRESFNSLARFDTKVSGNR